MASPHQIISWGGGGSSLALRFVLRTIPEREARTLPLKRGTPITAPVALEMIAMIAAAIAAPVITALVRPFVATLIIETPLQALRSFRTPVCHEASTASTITAIGAGTLLIIGAPPASLIHAPPANRRLSIPRAAASIGISIDIRTTSVAAPRSSSPGRTAGTAFKARAHGRGVEDVERLPA